MDDHKLQQTSKAMIIITSGMVAGATFFLALALFMGFVSGPPEPAPAAEQPADNEINQSSTTPTPSPEQSPQTSPEEETVPVRFIVLTACFAITRYFFLSVAEVTLSLNVSVPPVAVLPTASVADLLFVPENCNVTIRLVTN